MHIEAVEPVGFLGPFVVRRTTAVAAPTGQTARGVRVNIQVKRRKAAPLMSCTRTITHGNRSLTPMIYSAAVVLLARCSTVRACMSAQHNPLLAAWTRAPLRAPHRPARKETYIQNVAYCRTINDKIK